MTIAASSLAAAARHAARVLADVARHPLRRVRGRLARRLPWSAP